MSRRIGAGGGGFDWRIAAIGGFVAVGLLVVVVLVVLGAGPNPYAGAIQADGGGGHIPACQPTGYTSTPPTSGCHDPSPANWGVYTSAAPTQQLIHNLEHGGIVIWYDPERVGAGDLDTLTQYVNSQVASGISGRFKFILSPWGGQDALPAPIVVTAWRYLLELDAADTSAIDEFTRAHYARSPEPNGGPGPPGT